MGPRGGCGAAGRARQPGRAGGKHGLQRTSLRSGDGPFLGLADVVLCLEGLHFFFLSQQLIVQLITNLLELCKSN